MNHQFYKFALVGCAGFLVDALTVYAISQFTGWYIARVISFLLAATSTWFLNRNITFNNNQHQSQTSLVKLLQEYVQYLASMLLGGLVNYVCFVAAIEIIDKKWNAFLGVALGSIAGMMINFFMAKLWVFRHRSSRK